MNKLPENWGVKYNGELEFYHVLAYLNCHHGCNFTKSSGFKGYTFGVINDKDKGIVSPFKVKNMFSLDQFIELSKERTVVYGIWSGDMEGGSVDNQLYIDKQKAIDIAKSNVEERNSFWLNHIHGKGTDEEDYQGLIFKQVSETVWTTGDDRIEVQEFELNSLVTKKELCHPLINIKNQLLQLRDKLKECQSFPNCLDQDKVIHEVIEELDKLMFQSFF